MEKQKKSNNPTSGREQKVEQALMRLDRFALQTALPRPWHAEWQMLFEQVKLDVRGILKQDDPKNA